MRLSTHSAVQVPLNREWFCGRLTHFNHPIIGPALSTKLGLQLVIPEFSVAQTFVFTLKIDETTNSVARGPCPYASTVPCSDKITFDLGGLDFTKKFKIGLVDYTLQLTGFKESRVSTSFPTKNFISNEKRENNAFLFARIVAACPETCALGGQVQLLTVNGEKTCGCDCGSTTCPAGKELAKDCSCQCPVGTCNGAPTDANCGCQCPTTAAAGITCKPPKTGWDTTTCECTCDDGLCGGGTLVDRGLCKCDCARVQCSNGRVANPANKCQCECLAQCGPKQRLVTAGGKCECQCDPAQTQCANGFTLEIDPKEPSKCRCGCKNVCGTGCGLAGGAKQCEEGPAEPCCAACQFKPLPCDDGNKCTKNDKCDVLASIQGKRSVCSGEPVCPTPSDTCTFFTCDPASGACTEGTADDGAACGPTGSDEATWDRCAFECRAGRCVGKVTNCDSADMQVTDAASCDGYSCNPRSGKCELGPKPNKACNDGNSCTSNDKCVAGPGAQVTCQGELNTCASQPDIPCHTWRCEKLLGECVKVPAKYKTPCGGDGTDACKTDGICSGGVCLFNRKCKRFKGLDGQCAENLCDAQTGQCRAQPRPDGSACILDNGRPRDSDFCGGNYTCLAGKCEGDIYEDKKNHSGCVGAVVVDSGAGDTAALVVGLSAAGAILVAILIAVLLMMFVNKSQLTDPSTWGLGSSTGLENNPLYDQSAQGTTNALYEG